MEEIKNSATESVENSEMSDEELAKAISALGYTEYQRLTDFISLSQQLKAKQDAIDIMASDSTPSAIAASYVADTLEPNSQGDLVTLVAKSAGEQMIVDNIYKRLRLPLDEIVYSLFKNAIVIGEFAHEADLPEVKNKTKSATEDVKVMVHNSELAPKLKIIKETTRVFPIKQFGEVVGFIEITKEDFANFNFSDDQLSYKDVVIHSPNDYVYCKFGFRPESVPLTLKVKNEDGTIDEYEIDQGRSLLEAAFPAWQTLSIMKDAINLARLAYSAQAVVVQTEVGNMTEPQIELARNKLKDLFENRLTFGQNGAKSYLQPQIKPNYIYSFTNKGNGAITTTTLGGDYNPGVLSDLQYFEDEFFGAMGVVKQHFARTSDSAGLDGGGAVEQYAKRYKSYIYQFKRLLSDFIKSCINKVLQSRGLIGTYDNFEVQINKSYEEEDLQVTNHQSSKLSFISEAIEFLGLKDEKKVKDLKLQALKSIITDKSLIEAMSSALLEESSTESGGDGEEVEGDLDMSSPESLPSEISDIGSESDFDLGMGEEIPIEDETTSDGIEGGETESPTETEEVSDDTLPEVSEIVNEGEIEEG